MSRAIFCMSCILGDDFEDDAQLIFDIFERTQGALNYEQFYAVDEHSRTADKWLDIEHVEQERQTFRDTFLGMLTEHTGKDEPPCGLTLETSWSKEAQWM